LGGGDALTEFGKKFWTADLDKGLTMLKQAIHSHNITSHYAVPLMLDRVGGIILEITDGDAFYYRGNIFYDLVKISVIRLAFAMGQELRKRNIVSVALTPGFHGVRIAKARRPGRGRAVGRSESENEQRTRLQFLDTGPRVRIYRPRRHPPALGRRCQEDVRQT
jgi:NAD(P)-dependent dehydrogenase (short-subunit alcohol dehydrogenase family)